MLATDADIMQYNDFTQDEAQTAPASGAVISSGPGGVWYPGISAQGRVVSTTLDHGNGHGTQGAIMSLSLSWPVEDSQRIVQLPKLKEKA